MRKTGGLRGPQVKVFRETDVKVWQRVKSERLDKEEYCVLDLAKWIGCGGIPVLWRKQSVWLAIRLYCVKELVLYTALHFVKWAVTSWWMFSAAPSQKSRFYRLELLRSKLVVLYGWIPPRERSEFTSRSSGWAQIVWWHETGGERLVAEEREVFGFQLFGIRRVQPDLG